MKLFSLCLEFIASNIHIVDSFIGFPDTIGKIVFDESIKRGQFKNIAFENISKANLKIYFDAYDECGILESLSLNNSHLFSNDALIVCPWLLKQLTCLDLSLCGLGDDHELLHQITTLQRLEVLRLHCNSLTDHGIRNLTAPLRFQRKGHCLRYLDLSSNRITTKCLQFLKVFQNMCALEVSDTCIGSHINLTTSNGKFIFHESCTCCDSLFCITTEGWAKEVLHGWKQDYNKMRRSEQQSESMALTSLKQNVLLEKSSVMDVKSFYSRQRPSINSQSPHVNDKKTAIATGRLLLVTDMFSCPHMKKTIAKSGNMIKNRRISSTPSIEPVSLSAENILPSQVNDKFDEPGKLSPFSTKSSSKAPQASSMPGQKGLKRKSMNNSFLHSKSGDDRRRKNKFLKKENILITSYQKEETDKMLSKDPQSETSKNSVLSFYSNMEMGNAFDVGEETCGRNSVNSSKRKSLIDELEKIF